VSRVDAARRDLLRAADEAGDGYPAARPYVTDPAPAFEQLVTRHKDAVYRQMLRVCGNQADAEDVLQDALLNAYRAMGSLRDPSAFQAWLARIARNVCFRLRHREALRPLLAHGERDRLDELPAGDPSAESTLVRQHMDQCVKAALQRVPELYRRVLVLRDVEGRTGQEAADMLGVSVAAVKSRLHRGRATLRRELDQCFR
jgi:RNA polymerase sigma-70 factor, ECF subfamily